MITPELARALAVHADAEQALCEGIDTWHESHELLRIKARRDLCTAILAARMARGEAAQARRQEQLDRLRGGCPTRLIFAKATYGRQAA